VVTLFVALARAQKYDAGGRLLWDRPLDFSEYDDLFTAYIEANRKSVRGEALSLWRHAISDGEGGCLMLLANPRQLTVYHLNGEGVLVERFAGPEISATRIYRHRNTLWAYVSSEELFLGFQLK
jgi:hypothetical protein